MKNILGMLVGSDIDRENGGSGVEGALLGSLAEDVVKVAVPIAVTFAIGWGVQYLVRRAIGSISGGSAVTR